MRLKKQQRLTMYIIMLDLAENDTYTASGFCNMWWELFKSQDDGFQASLYNDFEDILPELYATRTRFIGAWFWNDWDERKEALRQCIKKLS